MLTQLKQLFSLGKPNFDDSLRGFMAQLPDRPPNRELAERAAERAGLETAAQAIGVEDHRRMLFRHQQRVDDGHAAMAQAAGFGDLVKRSRKQNEDEMGDLSVTGDQYHLHQKSGGPWGPLLTGGALAALAFAAWQLMADKSTDRVIEKPGVDYKVDVEVIPPP